ncbi:MAG TPA: hypothetical protein P5234_00950 [Thermoanaerobaculaceae bacterium]|nr:hypothetical protein [Thermoanaerobaculaceae bacterium]HRS14796.1 hypothetical protein [Thermoanaerobaculaceae bacterium]
MTQRITTHWECQPEAERLVLGWWQQAVDAALPLRQMEKAARALADCRLFDFVDHLVVADGSAVRAQLGAVGYAVADFEASEPDTPFRHPGSILPPVLLRAGTPAAGAVLGVGLAVDSVAELLTVWGVDAPIAGTPLAPLRSARVWSGEGWFVDAVERRGGRGFVPVRQEPAQIEALLDASERWAVRPRRGADTAGLMASTLELARWLVDELGRDRAAWAVFAAERAYWARHNRAGRVQKERQDQLGFGWANHDHHTFRSSREHFPVLIQILETLGFVPRERFYAGAEAGWGAQVLQQPACGLAVFADVDLSPDEVAGDFAHQGLPPRPRLGTIGLWCALHGESMLGAGLHHLAVRLSFDDAVAGLGRAGVATMPPFSSFPYLRQAFTEGERWPVAPERLDTLRASGALDGDAAARFARDGAIGSHLENIERNQGFGGFNQERISDIIRRTDPRLPAAGA